MSSTALTAPPKTSGQPQQRRRGPQDEEEFGFRVDKPPDKPGVGDPIDLGPFASDPEVALPLPERKR